jgi:hypothetical protein
MSTQIENDPIVISSVKDTTTTKNSKNYIKLLYESNLTSLKIEKMDMRIRFTMDELNFIKNWNKYLMNNFIPTLYKFDDKAILTGSTLVNYIIDTPMGGDRDMDVVLFESCPSPAGFARDIIVTNAAYITGLANQDIDKMTKFTCDVENFCDLSKGILDNSLSMFYLCKKFLDPENKFTFIKNNQNKTTINFDIINLSNKGGNVLYWNRTIPIFGSKAIYKEINNRYSEIQLLPIFYDYIVNGKQKQIESTLDNLLVLLKGLKIFNTHGVYRPNGEYLPIRKTEMFNETDEFLEIKDDLKYEYTDISKSIMKRLFSIGDPILINSKFMLSFWICGELLTNKIPKDFEYVFGTNSRIVIESFKKEFGDNPIHNITTDNHECICNICHDKFKLSSPIIITKCKHYYHLPCYINMVINYVAGKISIFNQDQTRSYIEPNMNACPMCRSSLLNIDWYSNNKTFTKKINPVNTMKCHTTRKEYRIDNQYNAVLVNGKSKDVCHLLIENLNIFDKYKTLEDYLVYKWDLIEKLTAFENISKDISKYNLRGVYENIIQDLI